jgi:hypothetical protein
MVAHPKPDAAQCPFGVSNKLNRSVFTRFYKVVFRVVANLRTAINNYRRRKRCGLRNRVPRLILQGFLTFMIILFMLFIGLPLLLLARLGLAKAF